MNKKLVIAINGLGGVGKDAFCDYCLIASHDTEMGIVSISSMDQVKKIAIELGWDGVSKTAKDRKMLSDLKDMSTAYNDGPFKYIQWKVKNMKHDVMFVHIREIPEIEKVKHFVEAIKDRGYEFLSIRVNREVETETNNTGDLNATLPYAYDFEFDNSGTLADLQIKANSFTLETIKPIVETQEDEE